MQNKLEVNIFKVHVILKTYLGSEYTQGWHVTFDLNGHLFTRI